MLKNNDVYTKFQILPESDVKGADSTTRCEKKLFASLSPNRRSACTNCMLRSMPPGKWLLANLGA